MPLQRKAACCCFTCACCCLCIGANQVLPRDRAANALLEEFRQHVSMTSDIGNKEHLNQQLMDLTIELMKTHW